MFFMVKKPVSGIAVIITWHKCVVLRYQWIIGNYTSVKKVAHSLFPHESVSPAVFSLLDSSFLCFLCYKKSSFQWENEIHSTSWVLPWTLFLTLQVFLQCHHKFEQNTDRMDIETHNPCCFQGVSQASIWISELGLGIF